MASSLKTLAQTSLPNTQSASILNNPASNPMLTVASQYYIINENREYEQSQCMDGLFAIEKQANTRSRFYNYQNEQQPNKLVVPSHRNGQMEAQFMNNNTSKMKRIQVSSRCHRIIRSEQQKQQNNKSSNYQINEISNHFNKENLYINNENIGKKAIKQGEVLNVYYNRQETQKNKKDRHISQSIQLPLRQKQNRLKQIQREDLQIEGKLLSINKSILMFGENLKQENTDQGKYYQDKCQVYQSTVINLPLTYYQYPQVYSNIYNHQPQFYIDEKQQLKSNYNQENVKNQQHYPLPIPKHNLITHLLNPLQSQLQQSIQLSNSQSRQHQYGYQQVIESKDNNFDNYKLKYLLKPKPCQSVIIQPEQYQGICQGEYHEQKKEQDSVAHSIYLNLY